MSGDRPGFGGVSLVAEGRARRLLDTLAGASGTPEGRVNGRLRGCAASLSGPASQTKTPRMTGAFRKAPCSSLSVERLSADGSPV